MLPALSDSLPGTSSLRRVIYGVGLVVLFRFLLDFSWAQVVVIAAILLVGDSVEIGREIPGIDERHVRLVLGAVLVAMGGLTVWRGSGDWVVVLLLGGGWLALDAIYSLRAGIRHGDATADEPTASEMMLSMQVGNLVAEELKDGPKTVPELAAATDMTESRVRDALEYHDEAGTAYSQGDLWYLDESKLGAWAFVRDNARRVVARIARPFRLFVPS